MIESHLLQSLRINGTEIDRGLIVRVQYIEAIEPVSPYLLLEIDDPNGSLKSLTAGRETEARAVFALHEERANLQQEQVSITYDGILLQWTTDPKYPARYKLFFVHALTFPLIEKAQVMLSAATPQQILQKLIPDAQTQVIATIPVTDFHCLHKRPIAQLMAWLAENGCALFYRRPMYEMLSMADLSAQQSVMEFYDHGVTSKHPALKVQYLGESYLMGEYERKEPFHFDMEEGPVQTDSAPEWSPSTNELSRRMGLKRLIPSLDFQTYLTFKVRLGERFKYAGADYLLIRGCWQEYKERASLRILGGKIYNHQAQVQL